MNIFIIRSIEQKERQKRNLYPVSLLPPLNTSEP